MDADESATKTNQSKHSYRLFERAPWKLPVSDSFVFRAEILEWNFYNTGHFSPFPRMICFSFSLENRRDLEFFPSLPPLNSILQVAGIDISSIVNSPFPRSSIRSFHFPPQLSPSSLFVSLSLSLTFFHFAYEYTIPPPGPPWQQPRPCWICNFYANIPVDTWNFFFPRILD